MFRIALAAPLAVAALVLAPAAVQAATTLYDQDFESPVGFANNGADITQQSVAALYNNQPPGFTFSQANTVETLFIGGTQAFGQGYVDPAGIGGHYAIGFLSSVQNDLLGLAFNVGAFNFLNLRADISSIDLSCCGGTFVPTGNPASIPIFSFSLYDNPSGANGLGSGTPLDTFSATGLINPSKRVFLFSEALGGLDASGSTNGNVILRIDLAQGGYAALDNLLVVASDVEGDLGGVPEPGAWALMLTGFGGVGALLRRRRAATACA